MMTNEEHFHIFSGTSHPVLAEQIATALNRRLGDVEIKQFPDGEIGVRVKENVRGRDVYIVQSIAKNPNHYLMELLILVDALKRASAREIVAVLPYFGYARQDRRDLARVPITAKLVADLLERAGVTRVVTLDLHAEQVEGFFNIPVDVASARPLFAKLAKAKGLRDIVTVAPDIGSIRLARLFAAEMESPIAIVDKHRVSPTAVQSHALIGSVEGKDVIMIDDICSTGSTIVSAARVCKHFGAKTVVACVTHAIQNSLPQGSQVDEFWVTNSIPHAQYPSPLTEMHSIANIMASVIRSILEDGSVTSLFLPPHA